MQDIDRGSRQLLWGILGMGVVAGAAVLRGVPWQGVLVALVTIILSAATVQGLRRRRESEPGGCIVHLRDRRGGPRASAHGR